MSETRPPHGRLRPLALGLIALGLGGTAFAQAPVTTFEYDAAGNRTRVIAPLNRVTRMAYDAHHRLTQVTDPAGGLVRYRYDALDRLTQVTDPRNLATTYTVDGLGNQTGLQSPDTGATQRTFDSAGNLLTRTDAKGQTTAHQYDALNRLVLTTHHDGSRIAYTWDQGANGIGRLAQVSEQDAAGQETGRTEYRYDPLGRIVQETRSIAGLPYVTAYAYTGGRLDAITYPTGRQVAYAYDAAGRVSQITTTPPGGQPQVVVSQVAYQPFGTVKSFTYGNGQTYVRSLDGEGRITGYSQGAASRVLGLDEASRITFLMDATNPANTNTYSYDALDRLTGAVLPNGSYGYAYDATGNRTAQILGGTAIAYSVSPASNQLQSVGTTQFGYDANGSRTGDGASQYAYDARGRLKQADTALGATAFEVNAQGERVRKRTAGNDRLYHYDTRGRLIAEGGAQGQIDREYLYLDDLPVAVIVE